MLAKVRYTIYISIQHSRAQGFLILHKDRHKYYYYSVQRYVRYIMTGLSVQSDSRQGSDAVLKQRSCLILLFYVYNLRPRKC